MDFYLFGGGGKRRGGGGKRGRSGVRERERERSGEWGVLWFLGKGGGFLSCFFLFLFLFLFFVFVFVPPHSSLFLKP